MHKARFVGDGFDEYRRVRAELKRRRRARPERKPAPVVGFVEDGRLVVWNGRDELFVIQSEAQTKRWAGLA